LNVTELQLRLTDLGIDLVADGDQLRVSAARGRLSPELQAAIREHRAELLRICRERDQQERLVPEPFEQAGPPLSFFQERLWVLHRLDPGDASYNMVAVWPEGDRYGAAHMAAAIREVVTRHAILRSAFVERHGEPQVQVLPAGKVPVEIHQAPEMDEQESGRLKDAAIHAAVHRAFNLAVEPPVRFQVWEGPSGWVAILVSAHHVAVDAWSMTLLREEIHAACLQLAGSSTPMPAAPPLQYGDFAAWQRRELEPAKIASQIKWWEDRLAGSPPLSLFPPDLPAREGGKAGATHDFTIDADLADRIRALGRAEGATLYMVLIAVCGVVLRAHTGQEDIVLGSPMGTRERVEFERMIGPFVNLLVLRLSVSEDAAFADLLRSTRDAVLDAHAHRDVPFEVLVERLKPARTFNHPPLFQVAVVLHNASDSGEPVHGGGAIHDFTWFVRDSRGALACSIEYRSDLYTPKTIEHIAGHLERVLAAVSIDSRVGIGRISLLSEDERHHVVKTFNDTAAAVDPAAVHVQIERQAARTPDAPALRFADIELTYAELNRRANQLARHLVHSGIGPGSLVGVCIQRSPELLIALIGVQKSGAAYVPLDPALPEERLHFMLADSGVMAVVASTETASALNIPGGVTLVDLSTAALADLDTADLHTPVAAEDPAYVIYTSGSTGKPKGVKVSHGALSNFLGAMLREPGLGACDVVAAVTTISFDIAGLELYLPLVAGARIELISQDTSTDGAALAAGLDSSHVSVLQATPVTLRLLIDAGWQGRRGLRVFCGGESLPRDLAVSLCARVDELWNLFGPTETTIWSTAGRVEPDAGHISIGRPIANTQVYIVGRNGEPVAIGLPGEIWIGGAGVAMGYHGQPELTRASFVPDRFSGASGRLYRTGDLGCWGADGRLYHLGRNDDQVKINGVRIEPGEIEAVIRSHAAVSDAVVIARDAGRRNFRLVAYVVYRAGEDLTATEVRRHVRRQLPDVMVPSLIVALDSLPVTPSGKVDRKALPDPFRDNQRVAAFEAPAPGLENQIAAIWQRILNVNRVGAGDNFFELGGHSLLALRVAAAVENETGLRMDPRSMFFNNLRQIATWLQRHEADQIAGLP
jgi:amino acid adenylation domain-containing protein